jgi:hypothetical protein
VLCSAVCPSVLFLFAIVSSVLRFVASDYYFANKNSLTLPLYTAVPVSCQDSDRLCICVRDIDVSTIIFYWIFWVCGILLFICYLVPLHYFPFQSFDVEGVGNTFCPKPMRR